MPAEAGSIRSVESRVVVTLAADGTVDGSQPTFADSFDDECEGGAITLIPTK